MHALTLRNIRSRFIGHGLGYLIALAWPTVHILTVVVASSLSGRTAPVGESMALFIVTGSLPFWNMIYLARFMMQSVIMTRPLLTFPTIKLLDVMLASAIQETLAACVVSVIFVALALIFDIDPMPRDIDQAAGAFVASLLLGLGFGLFNSVIVMAWPFWMTVFALSSILFWIASGVLFVPDMFPEPLRTIASYNPMLQLVTWMRSAYYEGYGATILDRVYTLKFGLTSIFLGLALERIVRRRLLEG